VTAYGRAMIEQTKEEVEQKFNMANGYKHDAVVIYGDTDSVMIKFGNEDLKECMDLGREAAVFVSAKFIAPIKLEFEKVWKIIKALNGDLLPTLTSNQVAETRSKIDSKNSINPKFWEIIFNIVLWSVDNTNYPGVVPS